MSYVVLARKWRPQSFEDLVGQEHVSTTIANAIQRGRVAHAFLFTGVRGVGKTTSARILAKALNCMKGPTPTPCQTCPACVEITNGNDVDVQEIDGASYTGVDDVRKLQETLPYRPQRDRFKIFIVDEVHMLSVNAWNAFLKTLEEPPPHVKFIFATTEVHKVPVTILSRCQRYDFKLISAQTIASRLKYVLAQESIPADDAAIATIAREAAGSMRDAMSLLDQVIAWVGTSGDKITGEGTTRVLGVADRQVLHRLTAAMIEGDAAACVRIVGELAQEGYDIPHVAKNILAQLRDLAVAKVCDTPGSLLDLAEEEIADVAALAARAGADDLVRLHQGFSKAFDDIVRGGQPRASLEMALIRLARRPPLVPVDELLRRLSDLERRLGGGPAPSGGGPSRGGAAPAGRSGGGWGGGPQRASFDGPRADASHAAEASPAAHEQRAADGARPADAPKLEVVRAADPQPAPPTFEAPPRGPEPAPSSASPPARPSFDPPARPSFEPPSRGPEPAPSSASPSGRAGFEAPARPSFEAPARPSFEPPSRGPEPAPSSASPPARPSFEAPARPSFEAPARPQFEAPARPSFEAPARPSFEAPARPSFEPPSRGPEPAPSSASPPARPSFEAPARPSFEAPARPSFEAPARPQFEAPARFSGPPSSPAGRPVSTPPDGLPSSRPGAQRSEVVVASRPAPVAPTHPATDAEIATWRAILDAIRKRRPALASVLSHAQIFDMTAERVTLAYDQTSFLYAQATEESAKELLTSAVHAHFGAPAEVVLEIAIGRTGTTIAELEARERRAKQEAARREVAEHPLVVAAIRALGAELIDVRLAEVIEA